MQTALADFIREAPDGHDADHILRSCVHCGFCNATCPTYQLLGDELDGPRGRIYLIKQLLEGQAAGAHTLVHLDRCLTCRNCETTCPSGVTYGRLLDIGREQAERRIGRPWRARLVRWAIRRVIPYRARFTLLLRLGQLWRPLLPGSLKRRIPPRPQSAPWRTSAHARRMLLLDGCVQPALAPGVNAAAARVFDRLGIALVRAPGAGCCGAASHHTSGVEEGLDFARRNIDAWWPHIEQGAEAIVMTASGCGVHVKDYGHLLRDDPAYARRAQRVAELTRDIGEILVNEDAGVLKSRRRPLSRIAFHSPCTLQHGQRLNGLVESLLVKLGYELTPVPESHLCCGSAGTYSLLQPELAGQLRRRKLHALQSGAPEMIVTANIGCLMHLAADSDVPVRHWIELLASDH
jgi:glycolate oxidase iron-sulfur subunit